MAVVRCVQGHMLAVAIKLPECKRGLFPTTRVENRFSNLVPLVSVPLCRVEQVSGICFHKVRLFLLESISFQFYTALTGIVSFSTGSNFLLMPSEYACYNVSVP